MVSSVSAIWIVTVCHGTIIIQKVSFQSVFKNISFSDLLNFLGELVPLEWSLVAETVCGYLTLRDLCPDMEWVSMVISQIILGCLSS